MNEKKIKEEWRDVVGYEGLYDVSDLGAVRSHYGGKVRYLKSNKMKNGYIQVALYKNGKVKGSLVHRIEWEAFRGPIPDGYEIDHINTIRDDNRIENLRVVSPRENHRNPITAERVKEANRRLAKDPQWRQKKRESNRRLAKDPQWRQKNRESRPKKAVLQLDKDTNEVVRKWECIADAGRELGIHYSHISACCHGKQKTAAGFRWKFATDDD